MVSQGRLGIGIDLVHISRIEESMDQFGERFVRRLFTEHERADAHAVAARPAGRLAAQFAAKEAALKALGLADAGVNWRDIEVRRRPDGSCHLALHGKAAALAQGAGFADISLSLSQQGDYATAVVVGVRSGPTSHKGHHD